MQRDVQSMSEMTAAHTSVCAPVHTMLQRASSSKSAPGLTLSAVRREALAPSTSECPMHIAASAADTTVGICLVYPDNLR